MRVRMKVTISGTRDGESWPERGGVVDLPDSEAEQLVTAGLAAADDGDEDGEPTEENSANPAKPETATPRRKPMTKSAVEK